MYFDVVEPVFISTVNKSSLGSISWATVKIFTLKCHLTGLQQMSLNTLTGLRFCIKQNVLFCFETTANAKHDVACQDS